MNIKSKQVQIAENVDLQVDSEHRGECFTVMSGRTCHKDGKEMKRTLNVEAKLGEVKIQVMNWFDSLKLR